MVKFISAKEAAQFFKNDQSVMIGGFLKCGSPTAVIDEILKTNVKNLTLIGNDTSLPNSDRGKLISAQRIKKAIVSHIGTNPETVFQMNAGTLEVELAPQGSLAERIRAGGAGLGGVLTPTGVGTDIEKGKQLINVDGKNYILEKPLRANIALIYATNADGYGNLSYFGSTRNFNVVMASAADIVIAEVDYLHNEPLDPNNVIVPGIMVDYIVAKEKVK